MSSLSSSPAPKLLPWGRLVLLSKQKIVSLPDHYDLLRSKHRIGRVANRCDIHIPKTFISSLHCIIRLEGKDSQGEPIIEVEDTSRHGVWVNQQKVGTRRKMSLKKGYVIHFTPPDSKVIELVYKFEILPSGLTKQNEDLHARLSADEMSVADRTRKRTHEELQCTQSPTKVVLSPPRPRPVKKLRRVTNSQQSSQEQESEPVSEPSSGTPGTQQSSEVPSAPAAGRRRRQLDVPAPDSEPAGLPQRERERLNAVIAENAVALSDKNKQLAKAEQELTALREEVALLKKAREEDAAKAEQELKALREENEAMKKSHEKELADVKAQAATDQKKELAELRHENDRIKRTLEDLLVDPKALPQVKTVAELEAKIQQLKREAQAAQDELALVRQAESHTTPPSKRHLVEIERKDQAVRQILAQERENAATQRKMGEDLQKMSEKTEDRVKFAESVIIDPNLSGSSQSQDSIDAGRLRSDRRGSQVSTASNEHSEPSPGDQPLTQDAVNEETKSGDTPQGRPPLFNLYGVRSATADASSSSITRPTTLSRTQIFRGANRTGDQETKGQQDDVEDEETKGNN